ncbi:uncharacterized protein B0I36DRAFT_359464 [Microdochium trichocladiopsis]|uniref:Uncharacterized protein n=1 Tax=Microdochium trichocladiopsis TaxID=1682393 RepID=A0A9P8YH21_9PEZI|nr:uncharacterized protein B0I36DRAFT_359464 [Microdochium trichocladiopsis]KAH7037824.1 hypothetical protein B0I36DRAFT_359464 [Microdochium trichocladiopsis]
MTDRTSSQPRPMPTWPELSSIGAKSLQSGAMAGTFGAVSGAAVGIIRSSPVTMFAAITGIQWFSLAFSYVGSRELLYHAWNGEENLSKTEKVLASGVAGGVAGMSGALLRSRRNILPGILVFSVLGAGSTLIAQQIGSSPSAATSAEQQQQQRKRDDPRAGGGGGILSWKYSPMTRLSDREYADRLEERLLRVDAEIAIIDETIAGLRGGGGNAAGPAPEGKKKNDSGKTTSR